MAKSAINLEYSFEENQSTYNGASVGTSIKDCQEKVKEFLAKGFVINIVGCTFTRLALVKIENDKKVGWLKITTSSEKLLKISTPFVDHDDNWKFFVSRLTPMNKQVKKENSYDFEFICCPLVSTRELSELQKKEGKVKVKVIFDGEKNPQEKREVKCDLFDDKSALFSCKRSGGHCRYLL
ncbi:MAG: hypothetical protein WCT18_02395 [Patescibacteria group bacterium]